MDVETWQQSLNQIDHLYKQRDYVSALKLVKSLLVYCPYSVELLIRYAKLIQLLNKEHKSEFSSLNPAFESLNLAYSLAPYNPETCIELGYFEYKVFAHCDRAMSYFETATSHAKLALKAALTGQIKCYIDRRRFSEARKILEEAKNFFCNDSDLSLLELELKNFASNS